ncbi:transcription factor Adf-1-like [Spea bombifrons]|uniref:transcription factor Adf-1-like n=1 Tax=Spea bombifrons TaxID=233779 RepID=UPI002348F291|nr:transcription factor Adf-1-like [Spea bombifrons]
MAPRIVFDVSKLIRLVEARPLLWDQSLEANKDLMAKEEAWTEIFRSLFLNWYSKSAREQGAIEAAVTKRWRSLRDRFRKVHSKKGASGRAATSSRKYKYYDQLLFLAPGRQLREAESNLDLLSDEEGHTPEEQATQTTTDDALFSEDEEPGLVFGQVASAPQLSMGESSNMVEDVEVPGPSGLQAMRSPRTQGRGMSASARRPIRRRLRPEQELNQKIISLVHRQRAEDDSDAFGRTLAQRLRSMDIATRNRCMTFILGCIDCFEPPFQTPPVHTLIGHIVERCTLSNGTHQ